MYNTIDGIKKYTEILTTIITNLKIFSKVNQYSIFENITKFIVARIATRKNINAGFFNLFLSTVYPFFVFVTSVL